MIQFTFLNSLVQFNRLIVDATTQKLPTSLYSLWIALCYVKRKFYQ